MKRIWLAITVLALGACTTLETLNPFSDPEVSAWREEIRDWREARVARLTRPDGWLSLTGLMWLEQGRQRVGSAPDNDIVLSGGPEHWGTVVLRGDDVEFVTAPGVDVRVDDHLVEQARLISDDQGKATVVSSGDVLFYVVRRGSLALRVKDAQAATRTQFSGIDYFPMDIDWRLPARFEAHPPGTTLEMVNVQGLVDVYANPGVAIVEKDGRTFRLETVFEEPDADELFIVVADRTSGRETYGAARFLYAPIPVDGYTVLDFNKLYNPPCAFTHYSTCSLPPPGNRMDIRVTAGELKYEGIQGYQVENN
ncbi:MAG: DUF1684 domain-containing protein [Wenzhouxiangellaceae bacterium]